MRFVEERGISYLPALDDDNGLALGKDAKVDGVAETPLDAAVDILLPVDLGEVGLGLGEKEGVDTTVEMAVTRRRRVPGDHDNRAHGAVLGNKAGRLARGGEHKDSRCVEVQRGTNGSHGARLHDRDRSPREGGKLLEVAHVGDRVFSLKAGLAHLTDGFVGVATLGRLTGKLVLSMSAPLHTQLNFISG